MPNHAIDRTFASELRSPASAGYRERYRSPSGAPTVDEPRIGVNSPDPRNWSRLMSALLDELWKKAQALTVEERAQLAQELLESVEREVDPEVQAAWEAEVVERIAKYERGEARLIPAEEVFAAARRLTQ
jgi:putative addiction module component (TIGR02574 family)